MEDQYSSTSVTSTVATSASTASSAASQPTYTTAGTPYRPRSSQPLQPPTRRGRLFKWSVGGLHTGLSLLPKSALPGLFPNGGSSQSSTLQQYTPLQQNNDRAINPSESSEIYCANMGTTAPRKPSGNTPTSLNGLFPELDQTHCVQPDNGDVSEASEEDDDFSTDPLVNMPVKSLQNLASYPNPNQKRAQKALLRGTRPNFKVLTATQSNGSSGPSARALEPMGIQREDSISPTLKRGSEMNGSTKLDPIDIYISEYQRLTARTARERSSPALNNVKNGHVFGTSASMTLASGPGAPQPLTAGPPGHRQLCPSTFESTLKALQAKQPGHGGFEGKNMYPVSRHTLLQAGIEDPSSLSDVSVSPFKLTDLGSPDGYSTTMTTVGSVGTVLSPINQSDCARAYSSLTSREFITTKKSARSNWTDFQATVPTHVALIPAVLGVQYRPGTDRMTDESIQSRMNKINRAWYAGADFMARTSDELVDEYRARSYGGFNETTKGAAKNKDQYRPLEIQEGNRMATAEHAKPLINMAMAKLQVYQEPSKPRQMRGPPFWPFE